MNKEFNLRNCDDDEENAKLGRVPASPPKAMKTEAKVSKPDKPKQDKK
ncbi:hypothetical protein [Gimesia sp.]|nr:hypothetical protein [Gimesia sp.]|tara:strand:- start:5284 stop:5427 length:144 start_codon:yes stop_codon:yes gene_type:complete